MILSTFCVYRFSLQSSKELAGSDGFPFQKMQTMASNMPYCFPEGQITWKSPSERQLVSSVDAETEMINSLA